MVVGTEQDSEKILNHVWRNQFRDMNLGHWFATET